MGYRLNGTIIMIVCVAVHAKSDDVLIALHQGIEAFSSLCLEVPHLNVTNNDRESTGCLDVIECLLEPGDFISGVVLGAKCVPVVGVPWLGIQ